MRSWECLCDERAGVKTQHTQTSHGVPALLRAEPCLVAACIAALRDIEQQIAVLVLSLDINAGSEQTKKGFKKPRGGDCLRARRSLSMATIPEKDGAAQLVPATPGTVS